MAFERVCKVSEVEAGKTKVFEVGDRDIAICNVGGEFFAIDDVCTHDQGPLDAGELDGYEIECPRHFARFDVRSGGVTALPAVIGIATFPVRVEGEDLEVDPDDPTEPEF